MKTMEYYGNGISFRLLLFTIHYITDLSPQLRGLARDQPRIRIATKLEGSVLNSTARIAQGMGVNGFAVKWLGL